MRCGAGRCWFGPRGDVPRKTSMKRARVGKCALGARPRAGAAAVLRGRDWSVLNGDFGLYKKFCFAIGSNSYVKPNS